MSKETSNITLPTGAVIEVDTSIKDVIQELNDKYYITRYCCGGHYDKNYLLNGGIMNIYISFGMDMRPYAKPLLDVGWEFDKNRNDIIRYIIPDLKKYKSFNGKTKKLREYYNQPITQEVLDSIGNELDFRRKQLLDWAKSLEPRKVKHIVVDGVHIFI